MLGPLRLQSECDIYAYKKKSRRLNKAQRRHIFLFDGGILFCKKRTQPVPYAPEYYEHKICIPVFYPSISFFQKTCKLAALISRTFLRISGHLSSMPCLTLIKIIFLSAKPWQYIFSSLYCFCRSFNKAFVFNTILKRENISRKFLIISLISCDKHGVAEVSHSL